MNINKTKWKVKSKALFKMTKSMFDGLGEKFKENTVEAKENMQITIKEMENRLKANDDRIEVLKKQKKICELRITQESYVTEKQREIAEKQREIAEQEEKRLQELEAVENGFRKKNDKIEDEITKIRQKQTKLQSDYLRAREELAEMEIDIYKKEEEIKLLEAPADVKEQMEREQMKREQKVIFKEVKTNSEEDIEEDGLKTIFRKKKGQQGKEKTRRPNNTSRGLNVYDQEELAHNMHFKLHILMHEFGNHELVKEIIQQTDTTIQYRYVDSIYDRMGTKEISQGIYYFKMSSDIEKKEVTMHYEDVENGTKLIRFIASGTEVFTTQNESLFGKEGIDSVARMALKKLCALENDLMEEREEEEKIEVITINSEAEVIRKNVK